MSNILIIGQGTIGTFLGATLSANENSVVHYVREESKIRDKITLIFNDRRNKAFRLPKGKQYDYAITNSLNDIQSFNQIIVAVSHNQIRNVISMLSPSLQPNQTLVVMGNVWNDFDWFEQHIKNPYIFVFPNFGGAIVSNQLEGWLTPNFTTGITNSNHQNNLDEFNTLLSKVGFKPKEEKDIRGWLLIHFAYNAGMLLESANQNGFQIMTKKIRSLKDMYLTMRECMNVVKELGIDIENFKEGRAVNQPIWWNALKTYFMFLIPGLAKSADSSKDIKEWKSYGLKIYNTNKNLDIKAPLLTLNYADE